MTFVSEIWHPNIDKNGDVCISILHEPGDDKWGEYVMNSIQPVRVLPSTDVKSEDYVFRRR
jgi:ubiquitin-protein ligase